MQPKWAHGAPAWAKAADARRDSGGLAAAAGARRTLGGRRAQTQEQISEHKIMIIQLLILTIPH